MSDIAEPARRSKRVWGLVLRLALSGALFGYLLSRLDPGELSSAMADTQAAGWLLAVLLYFLSQITSGIRWGTLARPIGFRLGWLRFQQLYFEGMFFSLCLPSSVGGDVVKALRLGGAGRGRILAACTILADRVAGLLAILLIGLTALAYSTYGFGPVQSLGIGLALLLITLVGTRIMFALLNWPAGRIPEHHPIAHMLERLMPYHHHPYVFWSGIGWSMVVQGLNVLTVMALGHALWLDLPAAAYCIAVPLVSLMTVLPISLNGVGVREGGLVWVLAPYGVSEAQGIALGLLWFSVTVATGLMGGLVYLLGPPLDKQADSASLEANDEDNLSTATIASDADATSIK